MKKKIKFFLTKHKKELSSIVVQIILIIIVICVLAGIKLVRNNVDTDNNIDESSLSTSTEMTIADISKSTESSDNTLNNPSDINDESSDDFSNESTPSDMDFTNPEEATEDTETTLPTTEYPYLVKVNRVMNCVTIYSKDEYGEFTVPFKAMTCSTGKYIGNTPIGTFKTSSKYTWRLMVDGTHSQYAYRIYGGILFHSVPCYSPSKNQLETAEFNKLGEPASLGCVRLTVADAKWLYDNCPYGTEVIIYDDESSPGPLGKPEVIKIPDGSPNGGWDPTDPDPDNPWNTCSPVIYAYDTTIPVGTESNILNLIAAADTCGNIVTPSVNISGYYDFNTPGIYPINVSLTDLLGRSATCDFTITVTENNGLENETTTTLEHTTPEQSSDKIEQTTKKHNTSEDDTTDEYETTKSNDENKTTDSTDENKTTDSTDENETTKSNDENNTTKSNDENDTTKSNDTNDVTDKSSN